MSLTCISYIPLFFPNIVPMCFHSVCARTGKIAMLVYTYSLPFTGVRACVRLGILPACVYLLPSIGLRACVWVYCLPAFICRLPLACVHCGVSPACVVLPPFTGFYRRACIVAYRLLALFFTAFHRGACIVAYRLLVLFCRFSLACGSTCINLLSIFHSCAYIGQTTCLCLFDHFWFLFTCMHWTNRWLAFVTTEGNGNGCPTAVPFTIGDDS